jgi:hypothetical protein
MVTQELADMADANGAPLATDVMETADVQLEQATCVIGVVSPPAINVLERDEPVLFAVTPNVAVPFPAEFSPDAAKTQLSGMSTVHPQDGDDAVTWREERPPLPDRGKDGTVSRLKVHAEIHAPPGAGGRFSVGGFTSQNRDGYTFARRWKAVANCARVVASQE